MAALLHDLGRTTRGPARSHAERSAKLAAKLLASYDLPPETQHAILAHGYRHSIEPATLKARVLYDADRLDSLGACGVMRWAMTTKRGRWPETATYHPDDPFALWRNPDGQHYLLDRFFTKLLQLPDVMKTETGRVMAERRIAFLRLYLQEPNLMQSWFNFSTHFSKCLTSIQSSYTLNRQYYTSSSSNGRLGVVFQ